MNSVLMAQGHRLPESRKALAFTLLMLTLAQFLLLEIREEQLDAVNPVPAGTVLTDLLSFLICLTLLHPCSLSVFVGSHTLSSCVSEENTAPLGDLFLHIPRN